MLWYFRNIFGVIKLSIISALVLLHFIMEAPIWALISRAKILGGGGGYHRYILVDNFINRFNEWALFGVESTAHWGIWMNDVSNFYSNVSKVNLALCLSTLSLALCLSHNVYKFYEVY